MAERFDEDALQMIVASIDAAEARIENGADIIDAFNWLRAEVVDVSQGAPCPYDLPGLSEPSKA